MRDGRGKLDGDSVLVDGNLWSRYHSQFFKCVRVLWVVYRANEIWVTISAYVQTETNLWIRTKYFVLVDELYLVCFVIRT